MPYNTGTPEDRRSALAAVVDLTKLQITLSTGAIVLGATFLEKFYQGEALWLLVVAWGLFGVSIAFGLIAVGQYVDQMAESNLKVRRGTLECLSMAQWATFAAALILFGVFAVQNVTASTNANSLPRDARPPVATASPTRTHG